MKKFWGLYFLFSTTLTGAAFAAACIDHGVFDAVLKTNVSKDGYVDYDAIRVNKGGDLYQYLSFVESADLSKCNDKDREAFWINAYNANVIRLLLARPQLAILSDDFKMYGERFKVAKIDLTLNEIHHRVIRSASKNGGPIEKVSLKTFDPRIHFALCYGAVGSPRLYNRAYTGATLESALQGSAVAFANNSRYVRIEDGVLKVSSVLRWYKDDFEKQGGAGAYLASLIDPKSRPDAAEVSAKIKTDFPDATKFIFDWTVNSTKNKPAAAPSAVPSQP